MLTLHHEDILAPDAAFHLVRATLSPSRPKSLHGHSYYQLLWVQNDRVRLHLPSESHDLYEGDLVFLRPSDRHAVKGRGEDAMIVALLLRPDLMADLGARHQLSGLFWSEAPLPEIHHLSMRPFGRLNQAALRLEQARRSNLEAEAFLLPLIASLCLTNAFPPEAPIWLREACSGARKPEVFCDGAAGLVRLTGRSHPHVARMMQKHLAQSPSDFVNDIRMDYAARALSGTSDSLAEIAAEVGLPNLSHFHKLFRARHGTTPYRYRKTHQRDVVQPMASAQA